VEDAEAFQEMIEAAESLPNLTSLTLKSPRTDLDFASLARLYWLEELHFSYDYSDYLSQQELDTLCALSAWTGLDIQCEAAVSLDSLDALTQLRILNIWFEGGGKEPVDITPITRLPKLRELTLYSQAVWPQTETTFYIPQCEMPTLRKLNADVHFLRNVKAEGLESLIGFVMYDYDILHSMPNLVELSVIVITQEEVEDVCAFRNLKCLTLDGYTVDPLDLSPLKEMTQLEYLMLYLSADLHSEEQVLEVVEALPDCQVEWSFNVG
jgi:hypothetical protein